MNIFDEFITKTSDVIKPYEMKPLPMEGACLELAKNTSFVMDKDTALMLGGYPKESINLIISSSDSKEIKDGTFIIGSDSLSHDVSFGKIVLLKTKDIPDDKIYDYTQSTLMKDTQMRFENVMNRTSPQNYYTNLKISKKAIADGFSFDRMAHTIHEEFLKLPEVLECMVILITGDSPIYKELIPLAENLKDVTVALNHIFDGIDMDCSSCSWSEICDEIEGLREMHRKKYIGT